MGFLKPLGAQCLVIITYFALKIFVNNCGGEPNGSAARCDWWQLTAHWLHWECWELMTLAETSTCVTSAWQLSRGSLKFERRTAIGSNKHCVLLNKIRSIRRPSKVERCSPNSSLHLLLLLSYCIDWCDRYSMYSYSLLLLYTDIYSWKLNFTSTIVANSVSLSLTSFIVCLCLKI